MYNTFVKKTTQKSPRFAHFCCFVSSILGLSSSFEDGAIDAQIYHRASAFLVLVHYAITKAISKWCWYVSGFDTWIAVCFILLWCPPLNAFGILGTTTNDYFCKIAEIHRKIIEPVLDITTGW